MNSVECSCNGRDHRLNIKLLRFVNFMVGVRIEWMYFAMFYVYDMPDFGPLRARCVLWVCVVCVFDLINISDTKMYNNVMH